MTQGTHGALDKRTAALTVLLTLALALVTGCLFPPVETDADDADERDPGPVTTDADDVVARSGRQVREGTFEPGVRVGGEGVGADPESLALALPPRVTSFVVTLEWFDADPTGTNETGRLHDLDLRVELLVPDETEPIWGPETKDDGGVGDPDSPVALASEEGEGSITVADQTILTATLIPESSTGDVQWVLTVEYQHLVTRA